jgi:ankyrin repeat protein
VFHTQHKFSNCVFYRFRWVFCQLETLRHVIKPGVRKILQELPDSLDETYERVLNNINHNNREHARRLLHCIAVAIRPLRVEELAEILAFDFDAAQGGIPTFHADWRPENQEEAVLSICSSLIVIVDNGGSRVVQFSHLSVKEFLTSRRLSTSTGHLSTYHILPVSAHTILAQACLGLFLHLDDRNDNKSVRLSPLAEYAARHWVAHAQFGDVASRVEGGMESLFDLAEPHFAMWTSLYDIDTESDGMLLSEKPSPLYYSAFCGFGDLVRHLLVKRPQDVDAIGGSFEFPLFAAICRNHLHAAELLLEHDGSVDIRDSRQQTALHKVMDRRDKESTEVVWLLIEHGADVNAQRNDLWTPLHLAVNNEEFRVARILLKSGADVNSPNCDGQAPLHLLSRRDTSQGEDGGSDIAGLLLDHGANVNAKDKDNAAPLHLACYNQKLKIVRVLLDHGANADAENDRGQTPLQLALTRRGHHDAQYGVGVARLLLEHGAETYARDAYHISMSNLACCFGNEKIGQVLLVDGGKFKPENNRDQTAFWLWIDGAYYSPEHSFGRLSNFPRVQRGRESPRQVRYNPVTFRIIPCKTGDGANAT